MGLAWDSGGIDLGMLSRGEGDSEVGLWGWL